MSHHVHHNLCVCSQFCVHRRRSIGSCKSIVFSGNFFPFSLARMLPLLFLSVLSLCFFLLSALTVGQSVKPVRSYTRVHRFWFILLILHDSTGGPTHLRWDLKRSTFFASSVPPTDSAPHSTSCNVFVQNRPLVPSRRFALAVSLCEEPSLPLPRSMCTGHQCLGIGSIWRCVGRSMNASSLPGGPTPTHCSFFLLC